MVAQRFHTPQLLIVNQTDVIDPLDDKQNVSHWKQDTYINHELIHLQVLFPPFQQYPYQHHEIPYFRNKYHIVLFTRKPISPTNQKTNDISKNIGDLKKKE